MMRRSLAPSARAASTNSFAGGENLPADQARISTQPPERARTVEDARTAKSDESDRQQDSRNGKRVHVRR